MDWLALLACVGGGIGLGVLGVGVVGPVLRRRTSPGSPLELVTTHLPVAVLLFAGDGRIVYTNAAARTLLFEGEDPTGRNLLRLLDQAPAPVCEALTARCDTLFSLDDEGGQHTFHLLKREIEHQGMPHTLLVLSTLTREVARREVNVLKKVIRVINHELNNSLASMSSLVSSGRFIAEHPDKLPNLGRVLDGIEERTQHLQRFLNEYAQLSRLPAPRPGKVDWDRLLTRLQHMFPDAQVADSVETTGEFDEAQIEQALINLLKNANEAGGSSRQVRLAFRHRGGALEIGVLDRGTGFGPEALREAQLPFYSTKEGGSGVGLALCREIAEGHAGTLRVRNREGGGSAVYLVLPLTRRARLQQTAALTLSLTRT